MAKAKPKGYEPRGFFPASMLMKTKPIGLVPQCGACGLYKQCLSPKMPVSGEGRRKILVVAEAPGEQEDREGKQLVGNSGRSLMAALRPHGVDMRKDCWLTNSLICRPKDNEITDKNWVDYCRPNLIRTVKELNPYLIIALGGVAVESLLSGWLWTNKLEDIGGISTWAGFQIPSQKLNAWVCPTYHPAYVLRDKYGIAAKYYEHHIAQACKLTERPWQNVPDYRSQVEIIDNPSKAARAIRHITKRGGVVAFDYETNMLKPDSPSHRIVSCSICWRGRETIAYPWHGEVIDATYEMTQSARVRKIASNMKFEDRWTRAEFGKGVRGWLWDTMLAAHVHDNRPDVTSIKFQCFVWLGFEKYDGHIEPFLKTKGSAKVNQVIKEVSLKDLLLYNGLDSLLEYLVAEKQMEAMGYATPSRS